MLVIFAACLLAVGQHIEEDASEPVNYSCQTEMALASLQVLARAPGAGQDSVSQAIWSAAAWSTLLRKTPQEPTPNSKMPDCPRLRHELQIIGILSQILDQRETAWILARPTDIGDDLHLLRDRWADLADAPDIRDVRLMPSKAVAMDMVAMNSRARFAIESHRAVNFRFWEEYSADLASLHLLHDVWDAIQDAASPTYYIAYRRKTLKRLKNLVGPEVYYTFDFPPPIRISP